MKTLEQRVKDLEQKALSAVRFTPGGGAAAVARLVVGGGSTIGQISKYQFTISPAISVPANNITWTAITVPGLAVNDWVVVNPPDVSNAPLCQSLVFAANTLRIEFVNPLTVAQNTATGTYTVIAIRV